MTRRRKIGGARVPLTKKGEHGTLYRWRFRYSPDPLIVAFDYHWHCWAYDREHAWEKWLDSHEDDGFDVDGEPERVTILAVDAARDWAGK